MGVGISPSKHAYKTLTSSQVPSSLKETTTVYQSAADGASSPQRSANVRQEAGGANIKLTC